MTCPIIRTHPAVIAQAAATTAALSGDRFWLGLGTGERLNEHIVGAKWPPVDVRQEMLEEAVDVIRQLWTGEEVDHHGRHFDGRERPRLHPAVQSRRRSWSPRPGRSPRAQPGGSATA